MNLEVRVNLDDFLETFNGETLEEMLSDIVKEEIMKILKKDVKYKAFVQKQASKVLDNLDV